MSDALAVRELATPAEWRLAWPVMRELRPNHDESSFLAAVERQHAGGYRLAALLDGEAAIAVAVAGFRHLEMLWRGAVIYGRSGQVHPGLASPRRVRRMSGRGFAESSTDVLDSRASHPWPAEALNCSELPYVDGLVTREDRRGTGAGTVLFDWLVAEARRLGCVALHLDSGVQRHGAHAFYFARGMHIAADAFRPDWTGPSRTGHPTPSPAPVRTRLRRIQHVRAGSAGRPSLAGSRPVASGASLLIDLTR